jgi:hypothetical protein
MVAQTDVLFLQQVACHLTASCTRRCIVSGSRCMIDRHDPDLGSVGLYAIRRRTRFMHPVAQSRCGGIGLQHDLRHLVNVRKTAQPQRSHCKKPVERILPDDSPAAPVYKNSKLQFIPLCKA